MQRILEPSTRPRFSDWWYHKETRQGEPTGPLFEWIAEGLRACG